MPKIYAIILAGGKGLRLEHELPKQFIDLGNGPIITWSLEKFNHLSDVDGIIVAVPLEYKKNIEEIVEKHKISKITKIVPGGSTRQGSSYNALFSMDFKEDDILLFHDAARPFFNEEIIKKCVEEAKIYGASGVYIKAIDTIAEADNGFVNAIPPRDKLYYTQTPQAFKYSIIKEAHDTAISKKITNATDDVQLVIDAGYKVRIVEGDPSNIKITTPSDLELARFIADRTSE